LSADFKDLILRLFSFDGNKRYTVEEIKSHPWMQSATYDKEKARATLMAQYKAKKPESAPFDKQPVKVKRAAKAGVAM